MERRVARVSEAQWGILLEFLEHNPNLARARGYNNSARGRAESARLWKEVADKLNSEGSGTSKTPKDWSIYVSNYKSKLKKVVADINADASATGGGPPQGGILSDTDQRFLAIMGSRFGLTAPQVSINPFPDAVIDVPPEEDPQQSTSAMPESHGVATEEDVPNSNIIIEYIGGAVRPNIEPIIQQAPTIPATEPQAPSLPRQSRRSRYRSRPLAPLDEARRILSQVEMQRAAADAASAEALHLIGVNLGHLAEASRSNAEYIGRIAAAMERYVAFHCPQ